MSNRHLIVWFLMTIVALVGVHVIVDLNAGKSVQMIRQTVLAHRADTATRLAVRRADEVAFRILKSDGWRFVEPFVAPCDNSRVASLLDALAFAPVEDSLTDAELLKLGRTREDFGLVSPRLDITLADAHGVSRITFGGVSPSGKSVYASVDGINSVFVISTNVFAAIDVAADGFRARELAGFDVESVSEFDLRRGTGTFARFQRTGDGWNLTGARSAVASASAVRALLTCLAEARAVSFVWPVGAANEETTASASLLAGYGLDAESAATVVLRGRAGADSLISFGKDAEGGLVYALIEGGRAIVTVDAAVKDAVCVDPASLTDTRLFPFERATIASFSITDGDTAYLLARDERGEWHLDAPVSASADAQVVSDLVDRLLSLRSTDLDPDGIAVKAGDASAVSVSRHAVLGESRLEDLRAKEILKIDPVVIRRIVTTSPGSDKPTSVVYDPDRRLWCVEATGRAGTVNVAAVDALLAVLNPLKATGVVKLKVAPSELNEYGLEQPAFTIAIDRVSEESVRRNIQLGGAVGDGRFATIGSSDAVFTLDAATVRALTTDLLSE